MKSGPTAGAIAGIIAGIIGVLWNIALVALGLSQADPNTPTYWYVNQVVFNLIWGVIFGVIFVMMYSSIPGKGFSKALYYGLLLWLIHGIYVSSFFVLIIPVLTSLAILWVVGGFVVRMVYAVVLGALYKK